jgi:hypothetical protein
MSPDAQKTALIKLLVVLGVWVVAVLVSLLWIHEPMDTDPVWRLDDYTGRAGYTKSLILILIPLLFLAWWYVKVRDQKHLRQFFMPLSLTILFTAVVWVLLDIEFANKLFLFPDPRSHIFWLIPGYVWAGSCQTFWTLLKASCYKPNIPLEEVLFYVGSGLTMNLMYMWAAEDFYSEYSAPPEKYEKDKDNPKSIIQLNWKIIGAAGLLFVAACWFKSIRNPEGMVPWYLLAELTLTLLPVAALYNRVAPFTNPQAFFFVVMLQILVSLIWEGTLALPYGWWNYQRSAMTGIFIVPWSRLPLEATFLWLSAGWSAMLLYEATKLGVLSGKSLWELLFGNRLPTGGKPAVTP